MTNDSSTSINHTCVVVNPHKNSDLSLLAKQLELSEVTGTSGGPVSGFGLVSTESGLGLVEFSRKKIQPVVVDFQSGKANHRRMFGGGKGQLIAKAVGLSSRFKPHLVDATAGLGGDAFVLASLGCQITLLERNPIVRALLEDGLARAIQSQDADLVAIVSRMQLLCCDSIDYLQSTQKTANQTAAIADVIYLDPMFPERKKSAAVKKEMQMFHGLVGSDSDQADLLSAAQRVAKYRVVVKRPRLAKTIGESTPTYQLPGKTSRFDIYVKQKMP